MERKDSNLKEKKFSHIVSSENIKLNKKSGSEENES